MKEMSIIIVTYVLIWRNIENVYEMLLSCTLCVLLLQHITMVYLNAHSIRFRTVYKYIGTACHSRIDHGDSRYEISSV